MQLFPARRGTADSHPLGSKGDPAKTWFKAPILIFGDVIGFFTALVGSTLAALLAQVPVPAEAASPATGLTEGERLVQTHCASCHGNRGEGDRGTALDAASGRPLWHFQTGGMIVANPISFLIDGRQHVAIAAGASIYVFGR